jgi:hypothetical protein
MTPVTNGPLSIDIDGNLTVAPNTPSGTYSITYEIVKQEQNHQIVHSYSNCGGKQCNCCHNDFQLQEEMY